MFTHLHCHSFYSFSRGTIPARELPLLAAANKMTAIAMTDTNNLTGALEFYLAAKKACVKPIIGVELRTRHESAVVLAKNATGYKELCEIITSVLANIPQTKPKLTLESLAPGEVEIVEENTEYHALAPFLSAPTENLIVMSASATLIEGLVRLNPSLLERRQLYIELIPHGRREWKRLRELCRDYRIPVVATNAVMLRNKSEHDLHALLRAIGTNTTTATLPEWEIGAPTQFFTTEEQLRTMLSGVSEEAFLNVGRIAEQCNVEFDLAHAKFGRFPVDDPIATLQWLAEAGFQWRYPHPTSVHHLRFEYELGVINMMKATSYFLVVHDMILFAKRRNFPVLGRGSGANSMIAYCLGISNVDPIACDLRFERFMNTARKMPPDFDIDFSWNDRYEVINYVLDKYGREQSAMLATVQTYRDRGSVREVGKALGYSDAEINEQMANVRTIHAQQERADPKLLAEQKQLTDIRDWMRLSSRIEGFPRHLSVHAGGVLIADRAITNYTPIQQAPIGVPITQQDMFSADDWKLIKLDILATRGLGTFRDTMDLVQLRYGLRAPIDDPEVAFNDEPTKELIRTGRTKGCFYIESPAMIGLLRKLRTDTFDNLTAASSVIRPGVAQSGMMQEFIMRHRDPTKRSHVHPIMGELMKSTYGVMVYQEDVLTVAHEVAGLSYGEADLMRRAMSGKTRSFERMSDLKQQFIEGAVARGLTHAVASEIWRQVESFGGYSFCKAHSASYAVLSFQKAWLKVYYPAEFMCSVLNNEGGFYRQQEYINEAKRLGVRVLLPDINLSGFRHSVEADKTIRLGFRCVRNLSQHSLDGLLTNRADSGLYRSIEDFAMRSGVTPEDATLLIKLGACASLHPRPAEAQMIVRGLLHGGKGKAQNRGLHLNLEMPAIAQTYDLTTLSQYDPLYMFQQERKHLGFSVTNHPYDFLRVHEASARSPVTKSDQLKDRVGKDVTIIGHISASKTTHTKRGDRMLMLNVSDDLDMMDVVVWPDVLRNFYTAITLAEAVRITGRVAESFDVPTIEAKRIERLEFRGGVSGVGCQVS